MRKLKQICIKLIELYQQRPITSRKHCRFVPTCSEYTKDAIITYGTAKGIWMGTRRILKCHPFSKVAYDPVIKEKL